MEEKLLVVCRWCKNEQFEEVEAVNFVKVELKEEFGGNILSDAEKTSINPTAEVPKKGVGDI